MVNWLSLIKDNAFVYMNVVYLLSQFVDDGIIDNDTKDKVLRLSQLVWIADKLNLYERDDTITEIYYRTGYNPFFNRDLWVCSVILMVWGLGDYWISDYDNLIDYVLDNLS